MNAVKLWDTLPSELQTQLGAPTGEFYDLLEHMCGLLTDAYENGLEQAAEAEHEKHQGFVRRVSERAEIQLSALKFSARAGLHYETVADIIRDILQSLD